MIIDCFNIMKMLISPKLISTLIKNLINISKCYKKYTELDKPFLNLYRGEKYQVTTKKKDQVEGEGLVHQIISISTEVQLLRWPGVGANVDKVTYGKECIET